MLFSLRGLLNHSERSLIEIFSLFPGLALGFWLLFLFHRPSFAWERVRRNGPRIQTEPLPDFLYGRTLALAGAAELCHCLAAKSIDGLAGMGWRQQG
jgi:hypothetical protein